MIPFSPVDLQREGVRLVSWVPSAVGGEMSLEADWQQIPATFSMLAERGMQVIAFSLSPGNGALNFSLQLVRDDEP
nr:DNA utilization protein HofO [Kluyvera ascorbata]